MQGQNQHHHHQHHHNNARPVYHSGVIYTEAHLPMVVRCYNCGYDGLTRAEVVDGAGVWVTCVVCCLLGCVLCAPCVFCMDGLKDVQHYCGSCHALVAVKKPCHWKAKSWRILIFINIIITNLITCWCFYLCTSRNSSLESCQMDACTLSSASHYFLCSSLLIQP